jgi:hypothetical protein
MYIESDGLADAVKDVVLFTRRIKRSPSIALLNEDNDMKETIIVIVFLLPC